MDYYQVKVQEGMKVESYRKTMTHLVRFKNHLVFSHLSQNTDLMLRMTSSRGRACYQEQRVWTEAGTQYPWEVGC